MANYQVISKSRHANTRWLKFNSYNHARLDAVAPLVLQEFPAAARDLPIGFMEVDGGYIPVAIQGLQPGHNLLVAPDGRWLGGYVPAKYRSYPFTLATTEDEQQVLCIDEDSELLATDGLGEALLNEDGLPSDATNRILNFLSAIASNQQVTVNVCSILKKHEIIQPWPIRLASKSGQTDVGGLFRIDENRFNSLPIEALDEIRQAHALPIIYLQLISMQNLAILGRLADLIANNEDKAKSLPDTLDFDYINDSGNISFN